MCMIRLEMGGAVPGAFDFTNIPSYSQPIYTTGIRYEEHWVT